MIKYALRCDIDHEFEAWFASSDGYDDQARGGMIECPMCGSTRITKAIMSPQVRTTKGADTLAGAQRAVAEAMYRLRRHVETTHDYVGTSFATQARDIHEGAAPVRPIYGEATFQEVKSLVEDGVPVAPLPVFSPPADDGAEMAPTPAPRALGGPINRKLN